MSHEQCESLDWVATCQWLSSKPIQALLLNLKRIRMTYQKWRPVHLYRSWDNVSIQFCCLLKVLPGTITHCVNYSFQCWLIISVAALAFSCSSDFSKAPACETCKLSRYCLNSPTDICSIFFPPVSHILHLRGRAVKGSKTSFEDGKHCTMLHWKRQSSMQSKKRFRGRHPGECSVPRACTGLRWMRDCFFQALMNLLKWQLTQMRLQAESSPGGGGAFAVPWLCGFPSAGYALPVVQGKCKLSSHVFPWLTLASVTMISRPWKYDHLTSGQVTVLRQVVAKPSKPSQCLSRVTKVSEQCPNWKAECWE